MNEPRVGEWATLRLTSGSVTKVFVRGRSPLIGTRSPVDWVSFSRLGPVVAMHEHPDWRLLPLEVYDRELASFDAQAVSARLRTVQLPFFEKYPECPPPALER